VLIKKIKEEELTSVKSEEELEEEPGKQSELESRVWQVQPHQQL